MASNFGICIIGPRPSDVGGISRWCSIYTSFLKKKSIKYYLLDTTPTISLQARKNIFRRVFSSIPQANKIASELKKLIKQKEISCVHLTTSASLSLFRDKKIIKICKKHSIPVIYHYHFGTFDKIIKKHNWETNLLIKNSNNSYKTICIDMTTYNLAKDYISNIIQIYNPVIQGDFRPNFDAKQIIFAGHVRDNKGINELVAAWEQLYKDFNDWNLIICGELFFNFIEDAKNPECYEKRIFFTGHVNFEVLQTFMSESSIFVLPSYYEGCPNVILEAMSHSMAIVATDVGAIPELISECGSLIHVKNVEELTQALKKYMLNYSKRKQDGTNARKKIATDFSDEIICNKYLKLARGETL